MEQNELKHYGVPGMKWGVRKAKYTTVRQAYKNARVKEVEARKQEIQNSKGKGMTARRAIKNAKKAGEAARWQSIKDDKAANKQARAAKRALAKMEKAKYKDFVNQRSKEILAGESVAGKIWDVVTNGHKYQAQIEYNIDKRK